MSDTDDWDGGEVIRFEPLEPDDATAGAIAGGDFNNVCPGEPGVFGCQIIPDDDGPLVHLDDECGLPGYISARGRVRLQGLYFRRDATGMLIVTGVPEPEDPFYEDDESLEDVVRAWAAGEKGLSARPPEHGDGPSREP